VSLRPMRSVDHRFTFVPLLTRKTAASPRGRPSQPAPLGLLRKALRNPGKAGRPASD
jgi:hypothetical protein